MKIRSISVEGLFNEFNYDLKLNPDLTFIHSPNGYGKTVLMHMIQSALRGDTDSLAEVPFSRLDIEFLDGSVLIIENSNGKLLVQMQKNELETPVTEEEMDRLSDIVYLPPDRLTVQKKDGHLVNALEFDAQELSETVRRAKEDNKLKPAAKDGRKDMTDSDLEFWCKDLKAKLDFMKDAGFEPELPNGVRFPPSRYDLMDNRESYEDLAYSIDQYIERDYQLAESIIVFKDIVNNIFLNKTVDISPAGKLIVTMNNGTALPLSKLSSGETQVMVMFYNILFHSKPGGIIIIDEPEISLHVSWQQMLGDYFCDVCRVRSIQMIVATHSPQVIHDKWDLATELVRNNA